MAWLAPLAWFGAAAIVAPALIHLLVQRRAERLLFPTLRFIAPTRLAAMRRHVIEDRFLLLVRAAILVAASAALAGPLLAASRRQAWNARIAQAVVRYSGGPERPLAQQSADSARSVRGRVFLSKTFEAASLSDGVARATAWLAAVPPARRDLVISGPLVRGSVDLAVLATVPRDVGIRLVRTGPPAAAASFDAGDVWRRIGAARRRIHLAGPSTSVQDADTGVPARVPVTIVAPPDDRSTLDAALAAVLSQHVAAPAPNRSARLVVAAAQNVAAVPPATTVRQAWIADAIDALAADETLHAAAARLPSGAGEPRLTADPWYPLAAAADGRPVAAAAASGSELLVVSVAPSADLVTAVLLRSIFTALAPRRDWTSYEILPIADADLRAWERPAGAVAAPRLESIDHDDRRWMWSAVLVLLAIEGWMRRSRTRGDATAVDAQSNEDAVHVA